MKGISARFHFKMTFIDFTRILLLDLVLLYSNADAAANPFQIRDYDTKVCNNEPTCNLTAIPSLTADKLTFPHRDCMCDSECNEYDDCCTDSQYIKASKLNNRTKTYYCSPEAMVYMVVSCLPDYADERIKANCAKALKPLEGNNFALIIPVTNTVKRITYANGYCALCNRDENFIAWSYASSCGEPSPGYLEQRAAEVKKESTTVSQNKNTPAATSPKPNANRLNLNVHLNPGAIFGNKDPNAGLNKQINIPILSDLASKLANKSLGSPTGLFGAKTGRRKRRQTENSRPSSSIVDIHQYALKLNEIMKVVKYDPSVKEFIANFENKTLVCKLGSKQPDTVSKVQTRRCVPNVISECPNDAEANKRCQSYTRLVHDGSSNKSYRNIDCAKCNGVDPSVTKLNGCQQNVRVGAQSLFASDGKGNTNNEVCKDPALAAKMC